jgi:sugar O-acyltransferase (sialic acid O-acetyltransferase NeuD family)
MKKVVIYGTSPAAIQSHYDFTNDSQHAVAGFTVERSGIREPELLGLPVVPFEEVETAFPPADFLMFVAVYFARVNRTRMEMFERAKARGYTLASYVSSRAIVWPGLAVAENCMICDGANVRPFTRIGVDTFIMPGATVGHDAVVGDHCYLAIHSVLLAGAKVQSRCVIGANATILNGVTVAAECVIGAGAVINADTKEKGVYTLPPPVLQPLPSDRMANVLFKVQV